MKSSPLRCETNFSPKVPHTYEETAKVFGLRGCWLSSFLMCACDKDFKASSDVSCTIQLQFENCHHNLMPYCLCRFVFHSFHSIQYPVNIDIDVSANAFSSGPQYAKVKAGPARYTTKIAAVILLVVIHPYSL